MWASLPDIQSAISIGGAEQDSSRIKLDVPGTEIASVVRLLTLRGKSFKVFGCLQENLCPREEDARLIAAAPETKEQRDKLLEACEDALDFVRAAYKVREMDDLGPWPEEIIAQLQAAIAKAKGEGDA